MKSGSIPGRPFTYQPDSSVLKRRSPGACVPGRTRSGRSALTKGAARLDEPSLLVARTTATTIAAIAIAPSSAHRSRRPAAGHAARLVTTDVVAVAVAGCAPSPAAWAVSAVAPFPAGTGSA